MQTTPIIIPNNKRTAKGSFDSYNNNNLYIIDLDTGEYLGLQGMPKDLNYDPNTKFTAVGSPGRNNPLYIFSGSEDVLEFKLSWFTTQDDRIDVISRCKWLEIMSKADGYKGRPHFVKFKWGSLFANSTWIVTSAKYTLSTFNAAKDFLPQSAEQTVGLRRVVPTNPTHDQIANYQW